MGLYHVSIFYAQRGDREGGWTTNFWNSADDDPTLIARLDVLVAALNQLAGRGCIVVKARYAVVPGFRIADEKRYTYATTLNTTGSGANADYQTTAVGIRLLATGKYKVNIWLSGNDDSAVIDAGRLSPSFVADKDWKKVASILFGSQNGWVVNVKDKARPKKAVTAIGATGTVTCPGHGFDGTTTVTLSRISGPGRPRGSYRITNISVNSFDLVGFAITNPAVLNIRNAIARPDTFIQLQIQNAIPYRATAHRRGRPTDLLSGKPKKRV